MVSPEIIRLVTPAPDTEKQSFWMAQALGDSHEVCSVCDQEAVDYGYYGNEKIFYCELHRKAIADFD